jgi:transposase-like protein
MESVNSELCEAELLKEIETLKARIAELEAKQTKKHKELPTVECEICHHTFKNKYILKAHMKNMHDETRERFNCPHCDKTFANKYYLKKHIKDKHSEESHHEEESNEETNEEEE